MFDFDVEKWVPKFILGDKNGYAIAKAIEAAMRSMNTIVRQGLDCLLDYDTMPEWRLDELAWELNCLYDFNASIETKREWIKNATPYYRLFGTPQAVYKYLAGYFDDVELEEAWQYGGDPFHFRITVDGRWVDENEAWARKAIAAAKNVRSVLDSLAAGAFGEIVVDAEQAGVHRFQYPMTSTLLKAGTRPRINTIGVLDDSEIDADAEGQGHHFPYPMTGTKPDIATMGAITQGTIHADNGGEVYAVPYKMCGRDTL